MIYSYIVSKIPIEFEQFLNKFIWPIDGTLTGITTSGQSGAESNGHKEVLHSPQISRTETLQINAV